MTLTKLKPQISSTLALKVVEYLSKTDPLLISDAIKQVEKPEPSFDYFFVLERTMHKYCSKKQIQPESIIGNKIGKQGMWERTLFMAVIFKLYSPEIFTGFYNLTDNLRKELAGMLECDPTWISQQVTPIISFMNDKRLPEVRDHVNKYVELLRNEITVKEVKEVNPVTTLFQ